MNVILSRPVEFPVTSEIAVALFIAWRVPDIPKPAHAAGFRAQWAGVSAVFRHPRFWWIAPVGACCTGTFFAVQGLTTLVSQVDDLEVVLTQIAELAACVTESKTTEKVELQGGPRI